MAEIGKIEVAPLRSLDEFLWESARFQLPAFNDLEKWNNRIIQNLLYYQSNYFLMYLVVFTLVTFMHPAQMIFGMVACGLGFGLFFYLTNSKSFVSDFKKSHPYISLILVLISAYMMIYLMGSVVVFIFGILFPIFVISVHASMRLRNLKNKIVNKVELVGLKRSPMGVLLDNLGIEQDFLM